MSDANFYQVLGVARSASADEIKSAYRELVKRYHPDLLTTAVAKDKATEKLRQINEAYAVLGNAERRRSYDQAFIQKAKATPRAAAAAQHARPPRPGRRANLRSKAAGILKKYLYLSRKRAGYALAASAVVLILIYAGRSEPTIVATWVLLEKLEVSPANSNSSLDGAGHDWVRVGEYPAVSDCATIIKQKVLKDKQEGSQAIFDERYGTLAITVHVMKETPRVRDDSKLKPERSTEGDDLAKELRRRLPQQGKEEATESLPRNGMIKRVRSLECREARHLESETWIRRALKRLGIFL